MFSSKQVLNDTTAPHEGALPFLVTLASRESGEFPTIPELFATVAREQTSAPAVAGGSWEPSYEQLDQAANAIAHAILDRPGMHGDRVALLLHHDTLQIAACLGVLKAGRIVVVLNPSDPAARHNEILADASPALIITEASLVECSQVTIHPASDVVIIAPGAPETLVAAPPLSTQPSDIAFLVYTSGSTGKPKGVMQTHESAAHNAWRLAKGLALTRQDRIILLGSLSGGQGVGTTWTALLNGATLCPFAIMDRGVTGLAHWMRQMHITIYVSSASTFRHFMQTLEPGDQFPEVRVVRLASEHATSTDLDQFKKHFSAHCRLAPTFSLSETGNLTQGSLGMQDAPSEGRLPVGRPSPGVEILLLDQS
ncbi:MAG TPA: AMP-binding protein, partial [Verrucomicrobium sp.]|nr:AMP-binding protein [Verrucomicrobium sp.]